MGIIRLWVAVLGFTQLLDVSCRVLTEDNPTKDVDSSAAEERIVGGQKAYPGQFPYVGALHYGGFYICTCVIISPRTILTAAHCVVIFGQQQNASDFYVVYGTTKRSSCTKRAYVSKIIVHPEYSDETWNADIAILRIASAMKCGKRDKDASPICLMRTWSPMSQNCIAAGWGLTNTGYISPEDLHWVGLKPSNFEECKKVYDIFVTECHLCMEAPDNRTAKGICQGDIGGPLSCEVPRKGRLLAGIATFYNGQYGCGVTGLAGSSVYMSISCYIGWIVRTTRDNDICIR